MCEHARARPQHTCACTCWVDTEFAFLECFVQQKENNQLRRLINVFILRSKYTDGDTNRSVTSVGHSMIRDKNI